jgi:hypothetical protein
MLISKKTTIDALHHSDRLASPTRQSSSFTVRTIKALARHNSSPLGLVAIAIAAGTARVAAAGIFDIHHGFDAWAANYAGIGTMHTIDFEDAGAKGIINVGNYYSDLGIHFQENAFGAAIQFWEESWQLTFLNPLHIHFDEPVIGLAARSSFNTWGYIYNANDTPVAATNWLSRLGDDPIWGLNINESVGMQHFEAGGGFTYRRYDQIWWVTVPTPATLPLFLSIGLFARRSRSTTR